MTVPFNNIPSNLRVPFFYAEMDNSKANISQDNLATLLIGQKLVAGVAISNKPVLVSSLTDALTLCGRGSMLARMFKAYSDSDPMGEIYLLPLDEPAAGVAAFGSVVIAGAAVEAGTLSVTIAGQRVQIGVASGDTPTIVAASLAAKINTTLDLPVTAVAAVGVVTLTCRWKGLTGSDITVRVNYRGIAGGEKTPKGLTITVTAFSGGTAAPDLSSAIAGIGDEPYAFIVHPFTDSVSLDAIKLEMNDTTGRWSYLRMLYGHAYSAQRGILSSLVAFGDTRNDQHMTVSGIEAGVPSPCWEYAASYAARNAVFIKIDPASPTQTGELTNILPALQGERFIASEKQSLLNHGIATSYVSGGVVRIERAITNYLSNAWGQDDTSYLDSETLHTSAYVIRRLKSAFTSKYGRCKLVDDGTSYSEGANVVSPSVARGEIVAEYKKMVTEGIVENLEAFKEGLIVERNASNPCRMDFLIDPDYANQLRLVAMLNQFRLQF